MIKMKSIAFTKKGYAESAIEKLRKGTDFQWMVANAEGQATAGSEGLLEFDGTTLVTSNLPEGVLGTVADAKAGEFRLHDTPEGFYYVLAVLDVVPAKRSPMEGERQKIVKKVFGTKLSKAVEEWGEKLRNAYPVKIYVTDYTR